MDKELPFDLGLALAGGAAKGLVHVALLSQLVYYGIQPKYITGASAGAIIAALYAYGYTPTDILAVLNGKTFQKLIKTRYRFINFKYLIGQRVGIYRIEPIYEYFKSIFGTTRIEDLTKFKLGITTTNLRIGKTVEHTTGELAEIVTKSMTFPFIFTSLDDESYDGGIRENCPVNLCRKMGADKVVAIDLKKPLNKEASRFTKSFVSLMIRLYETIWNDEVDSDISGADLILNPFVNLGFFEFNRYNEVKIILQKEGFIDSLLKTVDQWSSEATI
jgi:NTE family protein